MCFKMVLFAVFVVFITLQGTRGQVPYGYQPDDGNAIYRYDWRVQDSFTGQDFGQEEVRQGYSTDGEYQVVLPDGRKQIVTYRVSDPSSGYVADVRYEGEASFVDLRPSYGAPAPFVAPAYTSPIPAPYVAPVVPPAPYVAPVVTPPPAPYAPATPQPPTVYAPALAPAPYQPYDPVQAYAQPSIRRYNYQPISPVAPAVPITLVEQEPLQPEPVLTPALQTEPAFQFPIQSEEILPAIPELRQAEILNPVQPEAEAAPVAPETPAEPTVLHSAAPVFREGYEDVERPVPVRDTIPSYDAEKPIFYSDLYGLRPQRKEKIHDMSFY